MSVRARIDLREDDFGQKSFAIFEEKIKRNFSREGANILFFLEKGKSFYLIKYEKHDFSITDGSRSRVNRNAFVGSLFRSGSRRIRRKATANVYGSHRLDFEWDEEFGIWLVCSEGRDLFLNLEWEYSDGEIATYQPFRIAGTPIRIESILARLLRRNYFEKVIVPFLESSPTEFNPPPRPRLKRRFFWREKEKDSIHKRFEKAVARLAQGDFVYVGSKEEVYLLTLAKNDDGKPYMQGTYTTSAKPMLFFSNGFLNFLSVYDARQGKEMPGFFNCFGEKKPFIFPAIKRYQHCQHTIFTGEPELITGDKKKALEHFATTDFAEFADVVEKYADNHKVIHPAGFATEKKLVCNSRYFY